MPFAGFRALRSSKAVPNPFRAVLENPWNHYSQKFDRDGRKYILGYDYTGAAPPLSAANLIQMKSGWDFKFPDGGGFIIDDVSLYEIGEPDPYEMPFVAPEIYPFDPFDLIPLGPVKNFDPAWR